MAGAKETPRQKMISMMYLVLTALLALNVSVEVLDAFTTVNDGLETSYVSVENKIEEYYRIFEDQYTKQPEKVAKYWEKANEIRIKTDELINYIERDIKLQLLLENEGGISEEEFLNPEKEEDIVVLEPERADITKNRRVFHKLNLNNIANKDKADAVTSFMITYGNADALKSKIDDYRQYIINTVEEMGIADYDSHVGLHTDGEYYLGDGSTVDWQTKHFDHVIIPAAISIINEIVGEIQTTEFDAISELFKNIGSSDYKFNKLDVKVFPKSTYVLSGQDYVADIFIAASDTTKKFDAKFAKGVNDIHKANANAIQSVSSKNGVVTIKIPATNEGEQVFAGVIEMTDPETGEIVPYPFYETYTVAPPSANVTPTKMNVMYRGIDNPISISAPGITNTPIIVEAINGSLTKVSGTEYLVKPGSSDNITTIIVSTNIDGKKVVLDNCKFRLKRTPSPTPVLNGKTKGSFTKEELIAADGFVLTMPDFDFEGYNSTVLSYDVSTVVGGYLTGAKNIQGRKFNNEVRDIIKNSKRGQRIQIENIKVKTPDGEERVLDTPITIDIKN